jgi:hypothetical protein
MSELIRLRNRDAERLEGVGIQLRPAALARVERIDRLQVVSAELEFDGEVLGDAVRFGRLRNGRAALLQVPPQHDLGRALGVGLGNPADDRVLQRAGVRAALVVERDTSRLQRCISVSRRAGRRTGRLPAAPLPGCTCWYTVSVMVALA